MTIDRDVADFVLLADRYCVAQTVASVNARANVQNVRRVISAPAPGPTPPPTTIAPGGFVGDWQPSVAEFLGSIGMTCDRWGFLPRGDKLRLVGAYLAPHEMAAPAPLRLFSDVFQRSCPTAAEIAQIRADFDIVFEDGTDTGPGGAYACSDLDIEEGRGSTVVLTIINLFRFFKWLRLSANLFPWQIPQSSAGDYLLYDFIKRLGIRWHIVRTAGIDALARGAGNDIWIGADSLALNDFRLSGLPTLAGIAIHEVRHTDPGGGLAHTCVSAPFDAAQRASGGRIRAENTCDPTMGYMGAWYVEYMFFRSCRDYARAIRPGIRKHLHRPNERHPETVYLRPEQIDAPTSNPPH